MGNKNVKPNEPPIINELSNSSPRFSDSMIEGEFWDEEYDFKNELIINQNRVSRNSLGGIQMLKKKKEKRKKRINII